MLLVTSKKRNTTYHTIFPLVWTNQIIQSSLKSEQETTSQRRLRIHRRIITQREQNPPNVLVGYIKA